MRMKPVAAAWAVEQLTAASEVTFPNEPLPGTVRFAIEGDPVKVPFSEPPELTLRAVTARVWVPEL
jgi:hypothetical protein